MLTFIDIIELTPHENSKTRRWAVRNIKFGDYIGTIEWKREWRKYCFFPEDNTVFDSTCLQKITQELDLRNQEHAKPNK